MSKKATSVYFLLVCLILHFYDLVKNNHKFQRFVVANDQRLKVIFNILIPTFTCSVEL